MNLEIIEHHQQQVLEAFSRGEFDQIEIIGEAANRVSRGFRAAHPEIPWQQIVAQRNILAHEYGEIDDSLVWRVATDRIPELISYLKPIVPPLPSEES